MPARRNTRGSRLSIWEALAIALVVQAVAGFALAQLFDRLPGAHSHRGSAEAAALAAAPKDLQASCQGDAFLASAARHALCAAPWRNDLEACAYDAQMTMWMELSSCMARNDPGTAVALVAPKQAEKLKPIDAEKLIEEVEQQKPKPPPTPVPVPQPKPEQVAQRPPPPPAPPRPAQVIETVKPNDEQEPDNARYLAEYNTKVEKEKVARGTAAEKMVAKSQQADLAPKAHPKDEPSVQKHEDRLVGKAPNAPDVVGTLSMRRPGAQSPGAVAQDQKTRGSVSAQPTPAISPDGYQARRGDGAIEQQRRERSEIAKGQDGAGGGAPDVPNLKPTQDVLERALGGGNVDHLENVETADETALSAKRWVYASFFNRMKRQVAQNWDPQSVWRRADPTGAVFGSKTRITEVRVSLSPKGGLEKIVITGPSGVADLDEEAVRAFHAAAPFPNPPDGLVDAKSNLITFGFSFYFEIGNSHTSWRVIRSN